MAQSSIPQIRDPKFEIPPPTSLKLPSPMATLSDEDRWSVRTIGFGDQGRALEFLEREPILNAYLISRLLDEGVAGLGDHVAVLYRGELIGIAIVSSNIVMAVDRTLPAEARSIVLSIFADHVLRSFYPPRAIISDVDLVDGLWRLVRHHLVPPTVTRERQPVYALDSMDDAPELSDVRYATLGDLENLVPACAAMHLEEVGINPLERDAVAYAQRVRELVLRRRALVLVKNGNIVFKTEFSAVTPQTVQLMGVWTRPSERKKGYAKAGLREICGHIVRQRKKVSLFVNDFNAPAIRLYESLGFKRVGTNRALIW
jgi:ribosomal protein S18 acetylase RimI-like enzyme